MQKGKIDKILPMKAIAKEIREIVYKDLEEYL